MEKITSLFTNDANFDERNYEIIREWIKNKHNSNNIGSLLDFVDIINDNDTDESVVWHYTKKENLYEILQPDRIKVRLTSVKNSSDQLESLVLEPFLIKKRQKILNEFKNSKFYEDLKKDFNKLIEKRVEIEVESYTFSMSRLKDSFAFWNNEYAGKDGFAIGFIRDKIKELIPGKIWDVFYVDHDPKVNLADDVLMEIVPKIIEVYYKDSNDYFKRTKNKKYTSLSLFVNLFSSIFKHKSWKYERETRIVLSDRENEKLSSEIIYTQNKKVHNKFFGKNVINSIILGPSCSIEDKEELENYLKTNEYITADNKIEVSRSHAFDLRRK